MTRECCGCGHLVVNGRDILLCRVCWGLRTFQLLKERQSDQTARSEACYENFERLDSSSSATLFTCMDGVRHLLEHLK